ncbi:MAG: hypothetical protein E6Q98_14975 [Rhodospirillaceae bacterium]|nr:MAG: hypothetical protein E6Q98_14975 [Rhodospirillaceae bacterium]
MLFILDTDVVSNLSKQQPNPALLTWLDSVPTESLRIPMSVCFEMILGIESLRVNGHHDRATELDQWLTGLLSNFESQIDHPDLPILKLQAQMFLTPALRNFLQTQTKSSKLKIGGDLIVAATAVIREATVVSFNVSDYQTIHKHFPLPGLYHPGRDEWLIGNPPTSEHDVK